VVGRLIEITFVNPTSQEPVLAICKSDQLIEGGHGVRFKVQLNHEAVAAFALRVSGKVNAFVNRCSHIPVELDWPEGQFLDSSGVQIVCATHGATYNAESGQCVGGPCGKRNLIPLVTWESDGTLYCHASQTI
jgi:nitrite reductase/ring-hydroxylating ferredoxin subunit